MTSHTQRRTTPAPEPGDEIGTLRLVYLRADCLRELRKQAAVNAKEHGSDLSLEGGYGLPYWVLATMHLANLNTVVEGWMRLKAKGKRLEHAAIDSALTDTEAAKRLQALRDGVFHFGAVDNAAILDILSDHAFLAWADKLHAAFGTFVAGSEGSAA